MTNEEMIKDLSRIMDLLDMHIDLNQSLNITQMEVAYLSLKCIVRALGQQTCDGMRDATEEERKSTKAYIDSISKPTGLQFDDIYEELDFVQPHKKLSVKLQLCEDCISREALLEELGEEPFNWNDSPEAFQEVRDYQWFRSLIEDAPSITPSYNSITTELKPSEDCISRAAVIGLVEQYSYIIENRYSAFITKIKHLPSVTPQPKVGKWIDTGSGQECSECGEIQYGYDSFRKYCPNCGADMRGDEE